MPRPNETPAWKRLLALANEPRGRSAIAPFKAAGIYADFSRQSIDAPVLETLLSLAESMALDRRRAALFDGGLVNVTEGRPALHTALRADRSTPHMVGSEDIAAFVRKELDKMAAFATAVRSGRYRSITERRFTDVVHIGIGGSQLGPEMACMALSRPADGPNVHFVSNVDGAHLTQVLKRLNPAGTLFTVASKTFTTDETMTNAASARAWLAQHLGDDAFSRHFAAITAAPEEARRQGYANEAIFEFRDWVGGRFSLWSTVGLSLALANGFDTFAELLAGAREMDRHFREAPLPVNLPVMLALTGIWNRNFQHIGAHAVLPYAQRLARLPAHLQQLEMESNGKSVDVDGRPVDYATCPVIFGEAGTNGQHSFHQLLHQGSDRISADILLVAEREAALANHHHKLLANALAQADALWQGHARPEPHRAHAGGRPVTMMALDRLDARSLGALVAAYEHKVFVEGVLWNIDSFDQWGVELGKSIAQSLLPAVAGKTPPPPHLQALIERLRQA